MQTKLYYVANDTVKEVVFEPLSINPKFIDLTGKQFSSWTVLGYAGRPSKWFFQCVCGTVRKLKGSAVATGKSHSCGCISNEAARQRETRHGKSKTSEYKTYAKAKNRCLNPKSKDFHNYGGRGIEFRFNSFGNNILDSVSMLLS